MTELRVHYWPATPHLRELKFFVNEKLELSVFCDVHALALMVNTLEKNINQMLETCPNE